VYSTCTIILQYSTVRLPVQYDYQYSTSTRTRTRNRHHRMSKLAYITYILAIMYSYSYTCACAIVFCCSGFVTFVTAWTPPLLGQRLQPLPNANGVEQRSFPFPSRTRYSTSTSTSTSLAAAVAHDDIPIQPGQIVEYRYSSGTALGIGAIVEPDGNNKRNWKILSSSGQTRSVYPSHPKTFDTV
jgi:hypothetical protein